jgi:diacylglycerol kinase family enzyme
MRVLLLVNTSASSVTARGRVVIQKALSADHDVTMAETSRRGHATRLALGAASSGHDAVVVLGGDGTLNEAANGLAGSRCALGVLPGGSTNVFARTIGFTNDPIEATGELLAALARPSSTRRIGMGAVNERYFLFHVGMGFDAAVVEQVERRATLKRWASHPLFVFAGFDTALRHYDRTTPALRVVFDESVIDDAYLTICLNSNPYSFLGSRPLNLAPEAALDRPLTAVTFRTLEIPAVLRVIASSMGLGRPVRRLRRIDTRTDLSAFVVEGHRPFPYQVDGDYLGTTERLVFRYEPEVLSVVMPGV